MRKVWQPLYDVLTFPMGIDHTSFKRKLLDGLMDIFY